MKLKSIFLSIIILNLSCSKDKSILKSINEQPLEANAQLVFNDSKTIYLADANSGKLNWKFEFNNGFSGNVTIDDNVGYWIKDDGLISFKLQDRSIIWSKVDINNFKFTPLIIGDLLITSKGDDKLIAFNKKTGFQIWEFTDIYDGVFIHANSEQNNIYAGTRYSSFFSINALNGLENWRYGIGNELNCIPVLYKNLVIISTIDGRLIALNKQNGQKVWERKLEYNTTFINLVEVDGEIIFCSSDGEIFSFNADSGKEMWKYNIGKKANQAFNYFQNTIFYSTKEGELIAFDVRQKIKKWVFKTDDSQILSIPTIYNGSIYFGAFGGTMYSLNIENGNKNWTFKTQHLIFSSPSIITKEGKVIRGFGFIDQTKQ